jgi:hypothetical protein
VHSGFDGLKIAENKFTQNDFTSFTGKFLNIHIAFISGHCARFKLKIRQIVSGRSMIRQFHEFKQIYFLERFCHLAQLCRGGGGGLGGDVDGVDYYPSLRPSDSLTNWGAFIFKSPPASLSLCLCDLYWPLYLSSEVQSCLKMSYDNFCHRAKIVVTIPPQPS